MIKKSIRKSIFRVQLKNRHRVDCDKDQHEFECFKSKKKKWPYYCNDSNLFIDSFESNP